MPARFALLLPLALLSGADFSRPDTAIVLNDLEGTWRATAETTGATVGSYWIVAGDNLKIVYKGHPAYWKLQRPASNRSFDMTYSGMRLFVLCKVERDKLTICYYPITRPLKLTAGPGEIAMTFERLNP